MLDAVDILFYLDKYIVTQKLHQQEPSDQKRQIKYKGKTTLEELGGLKAKVRHTHIHNSGGGVGVFGVSGLALAICYIAKHGNKMHVVKQCPIPSPQWRNGFLTIAIFNGNVSCQKLAGLSSSVSEPRSAECAACCAAIGYQLMVTLVYISRVVDK